MVAFSLTTTLWALALLSPPTSPLFASAELEDVQDILWEEAQRNATLLAELEPLFGYEDARNEGPEKRNSNPLALKNLFKRAGCTFYRSGDAMTCITAGDICCTDPNAAQDGWCCPNTDGCGPGPGTVGKCTYRVSWTTTTMWYTDYTTDYETFTSTLGGSGDGTTLTYTSWTTVSADMDVATEWVTVTSTSAQAGKRAEPTEPALTPCHSSSLPSSTLSNPTATSSVEKQPNHHEQEVMKPKTTEAPKYLQIRGLLIPRQTMRTDTSERTVYRTTYFTTTRTTTVYRTSTGDFSTDWITSIGTRTAALNAKTTVTSTTTLYLRPGETAPASPQDSTNLTGGGSSSRKKKGLGGGARAGIGVGVSLAFAALAALVGFLVRRHKAKKDGAAAADAGVGQNPEYKPPIQSPMVPPGTMNAAPTPMTPGSQMSDPRYSQMTQTPPVQYGTPFPGPVYNYPPQGAAAAPPVPMGSPPPQGMHPSPPPGQYPQMQQGMAPMPMGSPPPQQYPGQPRYQYPRPPSPVLNNGSGGGSPVGMQQSMPMQPGMQGVQVPPSEMPAVYSPHPQRPA